MSLPELEISHLYSDDSNFSKDCDVATIESVRTREKEIIRILSDDVWKPTGQRRAILMLILELEKGQR